MLERLRRWMEAGPSQKVRIALQLAMALAGRGGKVVCDVERCSERLLRQAAWISERVMRGRVWWGRAWEAALCVGVER